MKNENNELYIPEYNPTKYLKASKIVKIISLICLVLMIIGVAIILLKAFLDDNSFLVNVNGISQKDWSRIIILTGIVVSALGIPSLLLYVAYIRLKQANAVFAEQDEQKRKELHEKFDKQARQAKKIWAATAATQVMQDVNKK